MKDRKSMKVFYKKRNHGMHGKTRISLMVGNLIDKVDKISTIVGWSGLRIFAIRREGRMAGLVTVEEKLKNYFQGRI
jgi:hypothetical protein